MIDDFATEVENASKQGGTTTTAPVETPVVETKEPVKEPEFTPIPATPIVDNTTITTTDAPETSTENTDPETEEEDEHLKEITSQTFHTEPAKETQAEEKKPVEVPADVKEQLAQFQSKAQQYDELMNDPEIAWAITAKKEGKSIYEAFSQIEIVDTSKLTPDQLFETHLNELKTKYSLTDDQIQAEKDRFSELSIVQQIKEVDPIRSQIEKSNEEKKRSFSVDPSKLKDAEVNFEKVKDEHTQKVNQETVAAIESLKGKTFYGVKVDDKVLAEVSDYLNEHVEMPFTVEETGFVTPNVALLAELSFYRTQMKKVASIARKGGDTEATLKVVKERQRVSMNEGRSNPGNLNPAATEMQKREDEVVNYFKP